MNNKFNLDLLGDIITPADLVEANFPGGRTGAYNLFHQPGFPKIKHGKRFLVSKESFIRWMNGEIKQAQ